MKLKSLFPIIAIISCICNSCSKTFLNTPDKQVMLRQAHVTNLAGAGDFMRGLYASFATDFYSGYNASYFELAADNLKPSLAYSIFTPHYRWAQLANDDITYPSRASRNLNTLWIEGYRLMHGCSFLLEVVDNYKNEDPTEVLRIKGQAMTMRALVYFTLVNAFSQSYGYTQDASHPGVPYITSSRWDLPLMRSTVKNGYQQMIKDLTLATSTFPDESKTSTQLLNKRAALAILARTYLFMNDYSNAKDAALRVIEAIPLMPSGPNGYPTKLFTLSDKEAIFQLTPASLPTGQNFSTTFQGALYAQSLLYATTDLSTIIKENPNDVRKSWIRKGSNGQDSIYKFPQNVVPNFPVKGASYYETMIRSSEMYLTCAEAYAHLGSQEDSARHYLDAIRTRADATAASTTVTGTALLDSIYKERRKELAFEGLRLFDLQRWKMNIFRSGESNPAYRSLIYPSNFAIAPIPTPDVLQLGIKQNEGY